MSETPAPALAFDHIGIVTADVEKAAREFSATIGARESTARFDDIGLGVSVQFIRDGSGIVYEMIAPLGEASPVAKTLASRASLLNQVAYRTPSITDSAAALRRTGNLPLGPAKPAIAFGGALVQFFMGRQGFVIELIEAPAHRHQFTDLAPAMNSKT